MIVCFGESIEQVVKRCNNAYFITRSWDSQYYFKIKGICFVR